MTTLFDVMLRVARALTEDVLDGTASGGSFNTLEDNAGAILEDNDWWNGGTLFFESGLMANRSAIITDFVKSSGAFTFAPPNRVTDPSFEVGVADFVFYGAGVTIAKSSEQFWHGLASCKVTPASGVDSGLYFPLTLSAGETYTFSADIKDVAGQSFILQILNASYAPIGFTTWTGDGQKKRKSVTAVPATTERHYLLIFRYATASVAPFYVDGYQLVAGTEASYLEAAAGDAYLVLTKAWPKSRLVQAIDTALQRQNLTREDETLAVVSGQVEYTIPTGIENIYRVEHGSDTDGWKKSLTWREENGYLRFYADKPESGNIRLSYGGVKHAQVTGDADVVETQVDEDLLVMDALAELHFARANRKDANPYETASYKRYQAEAERLRARRREPNPDPRLSGW
jgi:hypothetical protein